MAIRMFELSHLSSKKEWVENYNSLKAINFDMRGLFEENALMKNCGITLIIGKNETSGRQRGLFHLFFALMKRDLTLFILIQGGAVV